MTTHALQRAAYAGLRAYTPDDHAAAIDLSDNTNRWGMPPAAMRAYCAVPGTGCARYPEVHADSLKAALAAYAGVSPSMIATGCGSDDVLDAAIRAFADPGDRVVVPAPSFAMIPILARMNGAEPVVVPLLDDYDLDVPGMRDAHARIVYVCCPNNPTGTLVSRRSLATLVEQRSGIVIIDEAYVDFTDESTLDLARTTDHVLVVRTFSKAFGLAGLRVGYGVGAPALIAEMEKARGPYKVTAPGVHAAVAALNDGLAWVRTHVGCVRENRERFAGALRERAIPVVASHANFVFAPMCRATAVAAAMRERGVAVRAFTGLAMISPALRESGGEALRISIGPWSEMACALSALDHARASCA